MIKTCQKCGVIYSHQVQAIAVGAETSWCPLFDSSKLRIVTSPLLIHAKPFSGA